MQTIELKPAGSFNPVAVPRHVVQQRFRAPKKNIPQTTIERNHILQVVRHYVAEYNPVPPMPTDELKQHADKLVELIKCDPIYRDYIGVLLNNEMWRESLASDNLDDFNSQALKTHTALPALLSAFATENTWRTFISKIEESGHLASATDLKGARKAFHPMSQATVDLAKALRKQDASFKDIKVFRCPMTKDAFPGAPRTAEWLQLVAPIRNPYFGAEMLDCGSEVK